MKRRTPTITRDALRLAVEADADPRTCARWLSGEPVRGHELPTRLRDAAQRLGLASLEATSASH